MILFYFFDWVVSRCLEIIWRGILSWGFFFRREVGVYLGYSERFGLGGVSGFVLSFLWISGVDVLV